MADCAVVLSRNVFARLPAYNPFVGTFHHAPSAGNRGAVYFSGDIVGMSELEERKKFRHHPLTGTFHSLPGYYDPLHRLSQFRASDEELDTSDTDSMRSFVAVDIGDGEDLLDQQPVMLLNQPKSLSRMHSDSNFCAALSDHFARPRRFSDSDAESFFDAQSAAQSHHAATANVMSSYYNSNTHRTSSTARETDATAQQQAPPKLALSIDTASKASSAMPPLARDRAQSHTPSATIAAPSPPASLPLVPATLDTLNSLTSNSSNNVDDIDMDDDVIDDDVYDEHCHRLNHSNSNSNSNNNSLAGLTKLDQQLRRSAKRRKSSSSSGASSTSSIGDGSESSCSPLEAFVNGLARLELRKSVSSTELSEGFISTGKGIFRKVAYRTALSDRERSRSLQSPTRSSANAVSPPAQWKDDDVSEYTQAAPRIPLNPFVARRLNDGEELRIMAVHRTNARRDHAPHVINPNGSSDDSDDESTLNPKPYFIHEQAVTDQYELVGEDQLGDGSYAVVKPAIRRVNGKEVAIKQIHKRYLRTEDAKAAVDREIEIHLRLRHKHIVRLHEVYETTDFLYLVMAKATKGNLKQLMQRKRRLPESMAAKLAQQIVRAVFFLHDSGVVHCDLKPENILLSDPKTNQDSNDTNSPTYKRTSPKAATSVTSPASHLDPHADVKVRDLEVVLCDFGLSVKVPDVRFYKLTGDVHKVPFTGLTGTPGYMAPEMLQHQPYGKPVDMWSVGIVIYEMLTGYQPFYPPHACLSEPADFSDKIWTTGVSDRAKQLVEGLLETDPAKRLTAADTLAHGWFDAATFAL